MKLPQEFDEHPKMSMSVVRMIIGVTCFISLIMVMVVALNRQDTGSGNNRPIPPVVDSTTKEDTPSYVNSTLTPDDLDFWDLYPEATQEELPEESSGSGEVVEDPATDGKHTLITTADGKEEWVLISPYLPKNEYDYTRLVCQSNLMKYYMDGKQVSYVGVDLSKYNDYVDFIKLKKAGVDFVMVRVGVRGYGTGQIMLDDYFYENIKRASDAGLQIGLYFSSQAISKEEAREEANLVLESIGDYKVSYPIAFDMEFVANDTARIEILTRTEKTDIAKEFLETIEAAGYTPMLYGNKEWLIRQVDLSKLSGYDVWLSQPGDIPDYPYWFSMWQYSTSTSIDGIAGYANMNISFIDYSEK